MSREEIQKLLGGYATDTLSEAERRALFEAALDDQELFDALAKEQALREALGAPGARRQLLEALEPVHGRWHWLRRPAVLALAGGAAALLIVAGLVLRSPKLPTRQILVAQALKPPAPVGLPMPAPAPAQSETLSARELKASPPPPAKLKRAVKVGPAGAASQAVTVLEAAKTAPQAAIAPSAPPPPASLARISSNVERSYVVLLRGSDGDYAPAPPDMVFHPGDSVRIQLVPEQTGHLQLYQRDANGNWQVISTQPVTQGQVAVAPDSGAIEYDEPGEKELLAVVSPQEREAVAKMRAAPRPSATGAATGAAHDSLQQPAVAGTPSRRVTIRITLEYR